MHLGITTQYSEETSYLLSDFSKTSLKIRASCMANFQVHSLMNKVNISF